jgi:putative aldouronate transport system substrate-binding protein
MRRKTMKTKKILSVALVASMVCGVAGCKNDETTTAAPTTMAPDKIETTTEATTSAGETTEKKEDYTYGLNKTFHSDEKVTYTMFFSDASWYAMQDTWKTEGIFKKLEDLTNVHLDIISYDSNDYMNNVTLDINAGESAYIIPKIYDDSAFVDGGAIVPISQYVQYMPNYVDFYNKYNMQEDLKTITRNDGNYYKLPGMYDEAFPDYSFLVRKDIFDVFYRNCTAKFKGFFLCRLMRLGIIFHCHQDLKMLNFFFSMLNPFFNFLRIKACFFCKTLIILIRIVS